MNTMASIIPSLEKDIWFTALDMEDAYFHMDIHPVHRWFLRFIGNANYFQNRVFLFGLATTRFFSKAVHFSSVQMEQLHSLPFIVTTGFSLPGHIKRPTFQSH